MQVCALRQSTEYITLNAPVLTIRPIPQDCRNPRRLENRATKFRPLTRTIPSIIVTLPTHTKIVCKFTYSHSTSRKLHIIVRVKGHPRIVGAKNESGFVSNSGS